MMQVSVVKIGGNVIDDARKLNLFLHEFGCLPGYKILVHGGGKVATEVGGRLGLQPNYVNGRRITDADTLDVVTMVYGGLLNKKIVAALQAAGCNAIGLTGADANLVPAVKRPVKDVDYGFVGDVKSDDVNAEILITLLQAGLTPVLAPLTHDGSGSMLNTNADTIAQEVAKALAAGKDLSVQLIYCFEKKGVLRDPADEGSVINQVTKAGFSDLVADGIVSGGMIPKLENALAATASGVERVMIGPAEQLQQLFNGEAGTTVI